MQNSINLTLWTVISNTFGLESPVSRTYLPTLLSTQGTYFFSFFYKFAPKIFQLNDDGLLFLLKRYNLISQIYVFKSGNGSSFYIWDYKKKISTHRKTLAKKLMLQSSVGSSIIKNAGTFVRCHLTAFTNRSSYKLLYQLICLVLCLSLIFSRDKS